MREVKFRGKCTEWHKSGEWVYGNYGYSKCDDEHWINCNLYDEDMHWFDVEYEIDIKTLGEYVEILDAYEGDILHGREIDEYGKTLSSWFGIVKYNDELSRIMIIDDIDEWYEVDDFDFYEVIGNIHENADLLYGE